VRAYVRSFLTNGMSETLVQTKMKKMKIFFDKRNNSLTKSVCIIHKGKQTHLKF
jgi:hypothetical protein